MIEVRTLEVPVKLTTRVCSSNIRGQNCIVIVLSYHVVFQGKWLALMCSQVQRVYSDVCVFTSTLCLSSVMHKLYHLGMFKNKESNWLLLVTRKVTIQPNFWFIFIVPCVIF